MTDTLTAPEASRASTEPGSAAVVGLLAAQIVHANRGFRRNPVMAVVTVAFPLAFMLMLGVGARGASPDAAAAAEAIQLTVPIAAVFAAVMAAYVMLPFQISQAHERGVLKRLRGTPLPMGIYITGQVISAVIVAALGTGLMLAIAMVAFGLEVPGRALPALILTLLAGVGCAAALGVAVAALVRGTEAVIAFTMGSFLLLAFASGMFGVGAELPRALDVITWWFPLRHFSTAFTEVFVPSAAGGGIAWTHLGALAAWAAIGVGSAIWGFGRGARTRPGRTSRPTPSAAGSVARRPVGDGHRPGSAVLMLEQVRHANQTLWRLPSSAFFSVAFPVLFTMMVPYAFGDPVIDGVPFARLVTPAMAVFGVVVTAFINVPENVAIARERGVLKRLRGTPLPASAYLLGRLVSIVWIGSLTVAGVFAAGWLVHDVTVAWGSVLPLAIALLVGAVAFAGLGLAVVALVSDAGAVPAVALGLFLPVAFFSDLLAFGIRMPTVLSDLGWIFPLKHLVHAVDAAFASGTIAVGHLGIVVLWGMLGALIAVRRFRWAPR
jgi:ABC-2 type transport system permease protein